MRNDIITIDGIDIKVHSLNTVIVGSGAAGFNAADSLYKFGQKDIAIVTEGINMGTSRNTGSDKQTYYKLSLEGDTSDSIKDMAKTLFNGGSMNGDIALVEAALSVNCFYKLVDIGVPFPHNIYGEYVGYKTDHDPSKRATSAGPLTSKFMTEKLEQQVIDKGITIFDGYRVIGLLTKKTGSEIQTVGLVAIDLDNLEDKNMGLTLFNCTNIIYAVGGPAGMYLTSVYPESQTGASGIAFEAGVRGINLTESQYGLASIKFRWNLSGTYQQVIPRYVSTNIDGTDEKEFLQEYFDEPGKMLDSIFLKGYQWPFDPRKIKDLGSSIIDILVYNETQIKGRKVYLDFTKNPTFGSIDGQLDFSLLGKEAFTYLKNSDVLFGKPIDRLNKMNKPAIELYLNNGIDLSREYLEIDVCAQHNNGGLKGNIWWESNVKHFFPVGEVCGTFGVYRPGGTALNSTQVGSYRAAQYITKHYKQAPLHIEEFKEIVEDEVKLKVEKAKRIIENASDTSNVFEVRSEIQANMTKNGAHIRSLKACNEGISFCESRIKELFNNTSIKNLREYPEVFINWDILITQYVYFNAIKEYIIKGGESRGSYLVQDENGLLPLHKLPEMFKFKIDDGKLDQKVSEVILKIVDDNYICNVEWKDITNIPNEENWFESVWNKFMNNDIIK